jgi:hypothetical protein
MPSLEDIDEKTEGNLDQNSSGCPPASSPTGRSVLTLEGVIELTGEFEHLNELVVLHLEKGGGFTTTASYFATVQPILDLLEVELRLKGNCAMDKEEMKIIVKSWIDEEIRRIRQ